MVNPRLRNVLLIAVCAGGLAACDEGYGYGYGTLYPNITAANVLGYSPGLPYAGPALSSPYTNPLFGVGLTPLGVQSYFAESNMLGRGQLEADRRTRADCWPSRRTRSASSQPSRGRIWINPPSSPS